MNIERLKQLMEAQDVSQAELADAVGVSQPFVTYMMRGDRIPSLEVVKRIAHYLGATIDELAG